MSVPSRLSLVVLLVLDAAVVVGLRTMPTPHLMPPDPPLVPGAVPVEITVGRTEVVSTLHANGSFYLLRTPRDGLHTGVIEPLPYYDHTTVSVHANLRVGTTSASVDVSSRFSPARWTIETPQRRVRFWTERQPHRPSLQLSNTGGRWLLFDGRGFVLPLAQDTFIPTTPRRSALVQLAGQLGFEGFLLWNVGFVLAHLFALVLEQGVRGRVAAPIARYAGLLSVTIAVVLVLLVWMNHSP